LAFFIAVAQNMCISVFFIMINIEIYLSLSNNLGYGDLILNLW